MSWSELHALDELTPSPFGILEPQPEHRRIITPPTDALVIVPGIAFTPQGHRIGYGRGYYDRFLAIHHGPTIGLAYDIQIIAPWQTAGHDIPVDFVITESHTYEAVGSKQ